MLKDLFIERNVSVYKVSKESNIPYTTLNELILNKKNVDDCSYKTLATLANYFNMDVNCLYDIIKDNKKKIILSNSWQQKKNKRYIFNIVVDSNLQVIKNIHPLKQKLVNEIYLQLIDNKYIDQVYIFGSSCTIRCHKSSDIDIAIKLKDDYINNDYKDDVSEQINTICNYNCDLLWLDRVKEDSQISNNVKKGVRII